MLCMTMIMLVPKCLSQPSSSRDPVSHRPEARNASIPYITLLRPIHAHQSYKMPPKNL